MSMLPVNQIIAGDCIEVMKKLPKNSVDLVVTSPPYWGLRDYGLPKVPSVFACGGIGLEDHPNHYIKRIVIVARKIRGLLKKTGSFYLNLGDTYFGGGTGHKKEDKGKIAEHTFDSVATAINERRKFETEIFDGKWLQPKQLLLIPSRTAIALQEDGWILRNDIVWYKPNHMPSSVKDRLTNSWEHVFHFVKSKRYFYDLDSIRKPHKLDSNQMDYRKKLWASRGKDTTFQFSKKKRYEGKFDGFGEDSEKFGSSRARTQRKIEKTAEFFEKKGSGGNVNLPAPEHSKGKNPADVLKYNSKFEESEYGQTLQGFIRTQSIAKTREQSKEDAKKLFPDNPKKQQEYVNFIHDHAGNPKGKNPSDFWKITTQPFSGAHFAVFPERLIKPIIKSSCPKDGIVLDPFCGSGTSCVVAHKLGRRWIGIDLNKEYCELAEKRLQSVGAFSEKLMDFNLVGL